MNLRIVILPAKVLADGSHKLRIAVSHNSQTRYIPTRFTIPSPKNLKKGNVVNVPNAQYVNLQLRTIMNDLYKKCDELENLGGYTCAQLVNLLTKDPSDTKTPRTVEQISEDMLKNREHIWAKNTVYIFKYNIKCFTDFVGKNFMLETLTHYKVIEYRKHLEKSALSTTTIGIRIWTVRRMINYAKKRNYINFKSDPFLDYKESPKVKRDVGMSLEKLRKMRDMEITDKWQQYARDLFMLSFYLCGMNLSDILRLDLTQDSVKFIRQKTINRRNPDDATEFTIQPEARAIINKYLNADGKLQFNGFTTFSSIKHLNGDHLIKLRKPLGFDKLIFYSARKTFAQIANELMIKDSVIEYCIGDSSTHSGRALSFYVKVNKRMADKAIRRVFDAVASTKTMEELITEYEGK